MTTPQEAISNLANLDTNFKSNILSLEEKLNAYESVLENFYQAIPRFTEETYQTDSYGGKMKIYCWVDIFYRALNRSYYPAQNFLNKTQNFLENKNHSISTESIQHIELLLEWFLEDTTSKKSLIKKCEALLQKYNTNKYFAWHFYFIKAHDVKNKNAFQDTIELYKLVNNYFYVGDRDDCIYECRKLIHDYIKKAIDDGLYDEAEKMLSTANDTMGFSPENNSLSLKIINIKANNAIKDMENRLDKKIEEAQKKNLEMLGAFSAIIAFIISVITFVATSKGQGDNFFPAKHIITFGLVMTTFVILLHLVSKSSRLIYILLFFCVVSIFLVITGLDTILLGKILKILSP